MPTEAQNQRGFAIDVTRRLHAAGFDAYWAGGCVRDQLMGRMAKDYDVATNATPDQIRELFGRRRTIAIGASFGVITVLGPRGAGQIEVATFRKDAQYSDGRHPDSVTFTDAEEDAQRRDFTINGLFFDPIKQEVIDYVGGQEDLQRRVIRAIGNPYERIAEDKLRMLRAVRFSAAFDFEIDDATLAAVKQMADELAVVSAERIAMEMRRILTDAHRVRGIVLLRESGLLPVLIGDRFPLPTEDKWQRGLAVLGGLAEPSFPLALAGLLVEWTDAEKTSALSRAWRLSNNEIQLATWLVARRGALCQAASSPWPKIQRLLIHEAAADLLALETARAAVHGGDTADLAFCRERLAWPSDKLNPAPLISGDDLIAHGVPRGRAYRVLLDEVRDAQLRGEIASRDDALALVDRLRAE